MADFDPAQLNALVQEIVNAETSLSVASTANDAAQAAAQAAIAEAAGKQQSRVQAHDLLWVAIDNLTTYLAILKTP